MTDTALDREPRYSLVVNFENSSDFIHANDLPLYDVLTVLFELNMCWMLESKNLKWPLDGWNVLAFNAKERLDLGLSWVEKRADMIKDIKKRYEKE